MNTHLHMQPHALFLERLGSTTLIRATCRCVWESAWTADESVARNAFRAHCEGATIKPEGEL